MTPLKTVIEADCAILISRALIDQSIVAFGEDGLGKYGQCQYPQTYVFNDFDVHIDIDDNGIPSGMVHLGLSGYSSTTFGHICTDKNFLIGVQKLLEANGIDPFSLSYSPIDLQPTHGVIMDINIPSMLGWA